MTHPTAPDCAERLAKEYVNRNHANFAGEHPFVVDAEKKSMATTFLAGWSSCLSHEPAVLALVEALELAVRELSYCIGTIEEHTDNHTKVGAWQAANLARDRINRQIAAYHEKRRAGV